MYAALKSGDVGVTAVNMKQHVHAAARALLRFAVATLEPTRVDAHQVIMSAHGNQVVYAKLNSVT